MEDLHKFVYSAEVLEFVKKCKTLTDMLENDFEGERSDFIVKMLRLLPAVYGEIISLPPNEPILQAESEKFVTEEIWSNVYQRTAILLGSQNEYLDVPDEEEFDRLDVISRELSEDLADIYQDIKNFLEVFDVGTEEVMNDALWECRLNFENYWGEKILRSCLNLHKVLIRDDEILDKMDKEFQDKKSKMEIKTDEWFISRRQNETGEPGEQGGFSQ